MDHSSVPENRGMLGAASGSGSSLGTRLVAPLFLVSFLVLLITPLGASAQLIARTITINGTMTDWTTSPSVIGNAGQYSEDCESEAICELDGEIQSTGRDLKKFAFTWDAVYLYFYVERYASTNNTTEWLFYLDEDADQVMESGERIFRVDWQGSNQTTNGSLCPYTPDVVAGDSLTIGGGTGDGYSMPGDGGACTTIYSNVVGGSASGLEMEARLPWSAIGAAGPQNVRFHISSSVGMNLPSQIRDNMGGPGQGGGGGGGQLFPPEIAVEIAADTAEVSGHEPVTFEVTLTNIYFDPFEDIEVDLLLPPELEYLSHTAPMGSVFVDTNSDLVPDQWQIDFLDEEEVIVLEVTARGVLTPTFESTIVGVEISVWTGTDTEADNNEDSVAVNVLPFPLLSTTKVSSASTILPGGIVSYTLSTTNLAEAEAHEVLVTTTISPHLAFRLNTYGLGEHFDFVEGGIPSTLSLGTPEYSDDGGDNWDYTPISGGGGAPAGYDAEVTNWRMMMTGVMAADNASFEILYEAIVE